MQPLRSSSWSKMLTAMRRGPITRPKGAPVVLFRAPWTRFDDGWCIAARANARAMSLGGIDVRLTSWMEDPSQSDDEAVEEAGRFATKPHSWDVHLFSCPLLDAARMTTILHNMATFNLETQAFQAMFERQYIEPGVIAGLNRLKGIWTQCSANLEVLQKHGVENTTLIRFPYFDDNPYLRLEPPKECRRFLWIGRVEHRKAPDNLIRAFLRAFKPGESKLTMKLSKWEHKTISHSIERALLDELIEPQVVRNGWTTHNWRGDIDILRARLSREDMVTLYARHDVYASASRGEGLDLPAFDAKLAGRVLVTTDSGGPRDFIDDGDVLVPATGTIPASEEYPWGEGATYSDYRLDDLIGALQHVRGSSPRGSRLPEGFRAENVSAAFRAWVGCLVGR
jgi:glycosyltransferase involved in cell wall biosynthesis